MKEDLSPFLTEGVTSCSIRRMSAIIWSYRALREQLSERIAVQGPIECWREQEHLRLVQWLLMGTFLEISYRIVALLRRETRKIAVFEEVFHGATFFRSCNNGVLLSRIYAVNIIVTSTCTWARSASLSDVAWVVEIRRIRQMLWMTWAIEITWDLRTSILSYLSFQILALERHVLGRQSPDGIFAYELQAVAYRRLSIHVAGHENWGERMERSALPLAHGTYSTPVVSLLSLLR